MKALFAVFAVIVGLLSQLILVGFLLGIGPVGINAGAAPAAVSALLVNLVLLLLFAAPHSVMARPAFKQRWQKVVSPALERSCYILASGVLLALLCLAWQPMPGIIWQIDGEIARGVIRVIFFLGLLVLAWAIFSIDVLHFHGLRQAFHREQGEPPFAMRGPYRWVRHPIQSGLIVALWATPDLTVGHALFAAVLTLYSVIATLKLEERDLLRAVGTPYERYRDHVPALIPWPRKRGG